MKICADVKNVKIERSTILLRSSLLNVPKNEIQKELPLENSQLLFFKGLGRE